MGNKSGKQNLGKTPMLDPFQTNLMSVNVGTKNVRPDIFQLRHRSSGRGIVSLRVCLA